MSKKIKKIKKNQNEAFYTYYIVFLSMTDYKFKYRFHLIDAIVK